MTGAEDFTETSQRSAILLFCRLKLALIPEYHGEIVQRAESVVVLTSQLLFKAC